jgi:hypothetical protein
VSTDLRRVGRVGRVGRRKGDLTPDAGLLLAHLPEVEE